MTPRERLERAIEDEKKLGLVVRLYQGMFDAIGCEVPVIRLEPIEAALRLAEARSTLPPPLANSEAARSAAKFLAEHARLFRHTEAVGDCPHCNARFLSGWALNLLGPEPVRPVPPGPADPPRRPASSQWSDHPAPAVEPSPQEPSDRIVLRVTTAEGSFHQHADEMAGRRDGECPTCEEER